jgi:TRAP-type C4-dicarboxylate transport system permease small subunit
MSWRSDGAPNEAPIGHHAGEGVMRFFRTAAVGLAAVSLIAMTLLTCANVVMRYFFKHPIFGAEEIVNNLLGVAVFAGMVVVALERGHISVSLFESFLVRHFGRAYVGLFDVMSLIGTVAVTGVLGWKVYDLVVFPEETVVLHIPMLLVVTILALLSAVSIIGALFALTHETVSVPSQVARHQAGLGR